MLRINVNEINILRFVHIYHSGSLIERSIQSAANAIVNQDKEEAYLAISFHSEIDQKEKDIEQFCLKLLLQQQPVAKDLRLISAALKMITDMERIGDQAGDISEITIFLSDTSSLTSIEHVPKMAKETIKMVTDSIDAFVSKDLELAQKVIEQDDIVDELFNKIKKN